MRALLAKVRRPTARLARRARVGTYLNDGAKPIPVHQQVLLTDRDRLYLGIWTAITLFRDS